MMGDFSIYQNIEHARFHIIQYNRQTAMRHSYINTTAADQGVSQLWSSGVLLCLCKCGCMSVLDDVGGQMGKICQPGVLRPETGNKEEVQEQNILEETKPGLVLSASSCVLGMTQTHQQLLRDRNHLCIF